MSYDAHWCNMTTLIIICVTLKLWQKLSNMKVGIMLCNRRQIIFIKLIFGHFERLQDAKNEPISSNWVDRNKIQHLKKGE